MVALLLCTTIRYIVSHRRPIHTACGTYHSSSFVIDLLGLDALDDREQLQVLKDDTMRRVDNKPQKTTKSVKECQPAMEARRAAGIQFFFFYC